ncbi:MAG: glycine oxidase ThiO [Candidatus Baltobacteraceae bacterium]
MTVTVVGGGIIGLSVAFELARRGAAVRVLEGAQPARAASWAAAGMLAPFTEGLGQGAMQALCEMSLGMYPQFARDVAGCSGIDPHLRLDGILSVAYNSGELQTLSERAAALKARGIAVSMQTRQQTLGMEPALAGLVRGSLLAAAEGHVDNRRLGRALLAACEALGVRVQTGVRAMGIEFDARSVLGVRCERGYIASPVVVNAAGAWAGAIAGVPQECSVPVRPVKGQMLSLALPAGLMRHATWVPGAYLVPRADGRLLVGATVEEADDTRVTAGGMRMLLDAAVRAAPALARFTVSESWAGVRPATPDALPCLGGTSRAGYFLAAGHYRNGILLAPATAHCVADAVERGEPAPEAFSVNRFHRRIRTA